MTEPIPNQYTENSQKTSANEVSRDQQSKKVFRFIEKLGADKIFGNEMSKRQFIEKLDFDSFKNFLLSINAIIRDISIKQRAVDGKNVYLKGFIESDYPPMYEDKFELLAKVYNNVKNMNDQKRDLKDIALLMSASINAIHLFNDGNGRTSRLTYYLLEHNFQGNEEDKDYLINVLGDYGREIIDINPSILFINEIDPLIENEEKESIEPKPIWQRSYTGEIKIEQFLKGKNFTKDNIKFITENILHTRFGFLALKKYLFSKGTLINYVKFYGSENKSLNIDFDKVIENLSLEGIEKIKFEYWGLQKRRVELLIDMISNPTKYPSINTSGKTAKEYFEDEITKRIKIK